MDFNPVSLRWTPPSGEPVELTGDISGTNAGIVVKKGAKGLDFPPVDLKLDELPALDDAQFRSVRSASRELMIPLFLWAPDRPSLVRLKRELLRSFNPRKGPGTLTATEGDGTSRRLRCLYAGGMEGDEAETTGLTFCSYGLILKAPPYWLGDPVTEVFSISQLPQVNFYTGKQRGSDGEKEGPFMVPGIHLSPSWFPPEGKEILISGDVDSWPVWTISATSSGVFSLANFTTGKHLELTHDFGGGDVVTIDTRPGRKTVVSERDGNIWPQLGSNPHLWPVPDGTSVVFIRMTQTGTSAQPPERGQVVMQYEPRYLCA